MGQQIRLSQFVLGFGPGTIIETVSGPRIIKSFEHGLFGKMVSGRELRPEDFEINLYHLTSGFLKGTRVFRVPSNAELKIDDSRAIYSTNPFPDWALCPTWNILYSFAAGCPRDSGCPGCSSKENRRNAIRFVQACPDGHLDDVDWHRAVHGNSRCRPTWYRWIRQGSGLKDTRIECPVCGKKTSLKDLYQRSFPCSGRFPERETGKNTVHSVPCNRNARIIQRQASNIRVPEIISVFTVPPRHTALHRILGNQNICSALAALGIRNNPDLLDRSKLEEILNNLVNGNFISATTRDEILKYDFEIIRKAIGDIFEPVPENYGGILLEEFRRLVDASIYGAVQTKPGTPQYLFEVVKSKIRKIKSPAGRTYRIVPVSRLNTVVIQRGYRRLVGREEDIRTAALVDTGYIDPSNNRWLPGVELMGEGIFIMLDRDDGWHFRMEGDAFEKWYREWENAGRNSSGRYPPNLFRDVSYRDELHPVFVWWHTLAHLLIRTISVDSGYSSASIRERVYLETNGDRARGGILLYTVQPGADGTLGGLVSLVPKFEQVLYSAVDKIDKCSSDPVCEENRFAPGRTSGTACYACVLVSETSCEHRNLWLDRTILMEAEP